jgi:cell division septation protein DedD
MVLRLFAAATLTLAAAAQPSDDPPVPLETGQTQLLAISGATAAYSLDEGVADVVLRDGTVSVVGMAPGTASIAIVTPAGVFYVTAIVRQAWQQPIRRSWESAARAGMFETQYDSFSRRLQNIVGLTTQNGDRVTSARLAYTLLPSGGNGTRHLFPAASLRMARRGRELTLFDDLVEASPLTVNGQMVRGAHYRQGGFRLHAGYSSFASFSNLLAARERRMMFGIDLRRALGPFTAVTPRLYVFPTRNSAHGTDGVVAAMAWEYRRGVELQATVEAAASRRLGANRNVVPGAYINVSHASARDNASVRVLYQPDGFATLDSAIHGFRSDGIWLRNITRRLTSTAAFDANQYEFAGFRQTSDNLNAGLRYALRKQWLLSVGTRYSYFYSPTSQQPATTHYELPVGIEYATPQFGGTLEYRYVKSNTADRPGYGIRASVRTHSEKTTFDLYADRSTQVPTLELIFAENEGLELALRELGLKAATPADLNRLLREYPELVAFGAIRGINVNLAPVHDQVGSNFWWKGWSARDARFGVSANYSRDVFASRTRESGMASLLYSMALTGSLNMSLQYSRFLSRAERGPWSTIGGWQIALRQQLNGFPSPSRLFARRGTINGIVFADPDETGRYDPGKIGIAGAEVVLDGSARTTTNREGRFSFERVPADEVHQVEVRYRSARPFRFTTSPVVPAGIGPLVAVGIGPVAGHLTVFVRDSKNAPVRNVRVTVSDGRRTTTHETADGKLSLDVAHVGVYSVSLSTDSLPAGYLIVDGGPRSLTVEAGRPVVAEFRLKALRSVGGRVHGRAPGSAESAAVPAVKVLLDGLSSSMTDRQGNYLFRNLTPGPHVITAEVRGLRVQRSIDIPEAPGVMRNIDLDLEARADTLPPRTARASVSPTPRAAVAPPVRVFDGSNGAAGVFVVQIGVFRNKANVRKAIREAASAMFRTFTVDHHELVIVNVGPYATREEAHGAMRELAKRHIEGIVVAGAVPGTAR